MNSTYILETAKNIKWESLKDCFGFIDYNVVDILSNIIGDDPNKREVAYWKLDNHIVTQGGVSESCFYILPFLNELVKVTKNRTQILNIIFEIFNGNDTYSNRNFITIAYDSQMLPFRYFVPLSLNKEKRLLSSIVTYMEANKNTYLNLLCEVSCTEELETLLTIILCFRKDPFVKECFYKAKELKRNELYKDIFDDFSPDIEEVH